MMQAMPAVFVHGNPETAAIWSALFDVLERDDLVALSPPGFGAPIPDGWDASRESYLAWLAAELEPIAATGPIDLVGHDWGGGHVMGLALTRPDLIRSWCVDLIGIFHSDYSWHDSAQVWRTAGAGEENVAGLVATPKADLTALFTELGMNPTAAASVAGAANDDMAHCILGLYRSADEAILHELGSTIERAAARPGLVIIAEHDGYVGTAAMAEEMAGRAGASVTHLSGVGHWWMMQDPAAGSAALEAFWTGL